jgi:hypothetical protein
MGANGKGGYVVCIIKETEGLRCSLELLVRIPRRRNKIHASAIDTIRIDIIVGIISVI